MLPCKLLVTWPSTVPTLTVARSVRVTVVLCIIWIIVHNGGPLATPLYNLQFQTEYSNKFQTPTAKKQRTSDTNSPFHSPPQFTNETYLEEDGCITASSYDEQVPRSPRVPHSWTLLNPSIPSQLMKKMNSKSTYPSCPWMLNPWTTSS